MVVTCGKCEHLSGPSDAFCSQCKEPLWSAEKMFRSIQEKQEALARRHQVEINALNLEINRLDAYLQKQESFQANVDPSKNLEVEDQFEEASRAITFEELGEQNESVHIPNKSSIGASKTSINKDAVQQQGLNHGLRNDSASKSIQKALNSTTKSAKDPSKAVASFAVQLLAFYEPVQQSFEFFRKAYQKYKREGKLPIFFMTLAGLIAILFGVGYLMQNSFQYMGIYADVVKVGSGFVGAIVAGGVGFRMYKKETKYHEFGSAMLSLGIIINYLMIYFLSDLGNFPLLSSAFFGFALIVANTVVAAFIALKYETKIVSVLSLAGGALAPFYLNATSDGAFYYLYLWILAASSCLIGFRIKWKTLQYLSFGASMVLLELSLFEQVPSRFLFTTYYHVFAYLFLYVALFEKSKIKSVLQKTDLIMVAANVGLLLMNLYVTYANDLVTLGLILLGNALLVAVPLFKKWNSLAKKVKFVFFVVIGSLLGLAIPALFGQALMGMFWSVEAIGLILLGFVFSLSSVRKEGYLVLLIAVLKLTYSTKFLIINWGDNLFHEGFLNFSIFGFVITSLWFFSLKFKAQFTSFEASLFSIFKEIIPLWLASIIMMIGYHAIGISVLNFIVVPMLGLIYWGKRFQTKYTVGTGISLLVFFVLTYVMSALEVQSFHFKDQALFAQIALLELFVSLWGIKFFFERIGFKNNSLYALSHRLRIGFFVLIPLLMVYQTIKHFDDYLVIGVWSSVLVAYFLHKKLCYQQLALELVVLFFLGILSPFYIGELSWYGALYLLIVLTVIFLSEKAHLKSYFDKSDHKLVLQAIPITAAAVIASLVALFSADIGLTFCVFALLILAAVQLRANVAVFEHSMNFYIRLSLATSFIGLGLYPMSYVGKTTNLSVLIAVICAYLLSLSIKEKPTLLEGQNPLKGRTSMLVGHQLLIVAVYTVLIDVMGLSIVGPYYSVALVIHAIVLLFMALKHQNKWYNRGSVFLFAVTLLKVVFYDLKDFETTEKIIVFILIGVLLLGASFLYVKIKAQFDQKDKEQDDTPVTPVV